MKKYKRPLSENKEFLQELKDLDNFMDKEEEHLRNEQENEQDLYESIKINGIKYPIHTIKHPEFLAVKLQQCYKSVRIAEGDIGFLKETEQPAEVIELKYKELNEAIIEYEAVKEAVKKTRESLEKIDDREDIAFNFLILKMLGETRDLLYNHIDERVNSLEEDIKKDTKYYILLILLVIIIIKIFL
jgi:hypothetical protein